MEGTKNINIQGRGWYQRSVNGFNPQFFIHGLDFSLQNITIARSKILWNILLEYPNKLRGYIEEKTNQHHSYEKGDEQKSKALEALEEKPWLYDCNKQLIEKTLGEIELDDLSDEYKKDDDNIEKLVKALGLKLDEIREFEEKTGMKVIPEELYDHLMELDKNNQRAHDERSSKNQANHESWQPEVDLEEVEIIEETSGHYNHPENDLSDQVSQASNGGVVDTDNGQATKSRIASNEYETSKEIGAFGELLAKKYLEEKYPEHEVIWLNGGGIGRGYDFAIKQKDGEIFYYEVKSKVDSTPQLFEISGTQWNWAKKLHEKHRGERYKILLISNVGKEESKVKELSDPVALWKEGKIYADLVRIKL